MGSGNAEPPAVSPGLAGSTPWEGRIGGPGGQTPATTTASARPARVRWPRQEERRPRNKGTGHAALWAGRRLGAPHSRRTWGRRRESPEGGVHRTDRNHDERRPSRGSGSATVTVGEGRPNAETRQTLKGRARWGSGRCGERPEPMGAPRGGRIARSPSPAGGSPIRRRGPRRRTRSAVGGGVGSDQHQDQSGDEGEDGGRNGDE